MRRNSSCKELCSYIHGCFSLVSTAAAAFMASHQERSTNVLTGLSVSGGLSTLWGHYSCQPVTQAWVKAPGQGPACAGCAPATGIYSLILAVTFLFLPLCLCVCRCLCLEGPLALFCLPSEPPFILQDSLEMSLLSCHLQ